MIENEITRVVHLIDNVDLKKNDLHMKITSEIVSMVMKDYNRINFPDHPMNDSEEYRSTHFHE
jgi:hypothetical protein